METLNFKRLVETKGGFIALFFYRRMPVVLRKLIGWLV